jgi:hypothetical protein
MLRKAPIPMKRLVRLYVKLRDEYASQQPDVLLAESEIIRVTIATAILSASLSALADIADIERHVRIRIGPPLSIVGLRQSLLPNSSSVH